ncbi:hypothetical protein GCM10009720_09290 [Yaniella flava]|uniref:Uncharacterized protein n=1 Tax=Yaniella flava TaxID=287930 RepID=A0ABN2U8U1_9MICC
MDFAKLDLPGIVSKDEEQAYLASASEGSMNHELSKLPVTIPFVQRGMIIALPVGQQPMIVTVKENRGEGSFATIIVASENPSYPVGDYIINSEAQLHRGELIDPVAILQ